MPDGHRAPTRPRLAGVDVVRLIGLVAIVLGHVYPHAEWTDRALQSWRLPLFFVITGYFWSRRRDVRQEVDKRARSLLLPYAVWLVLVTLLVVPLRWEDAGEIVPDALLGGSYATRPYTTFWFFTALFVAAVLYRVLERFPPLVRGAVIAGGLLANLLAGPALARVPLSTATALGALAFIWLGARLRSGQEDGRWWARPAVAAAVVVVVAVVVWWLPGDFEPLDMKRGQFPLLAVVVAGAISAALICLATSVRLPDRLQGPLEAVARPALVVIVLHPVVLLVLPPEATPVPLPVVAALAFLGPLLVGLVAVRTPLSPYLAGVPGPAPDVAPGVRIGSRARPD